MHTIWQVHYLRHGINKQGAPYSSFYQIYFVQKKKEGFQSWFQVIRIIPCTSLSAAVFRQYGGSTNPKLWHCACLQLQYIEWIIYQRNHSVQVSRSISQLTMSIVYILELRRLDFRRYYFHGSMLCFLCRTIVVDENVIWNMGLAAFGNLEVWYWKGRFLLTRLHHILDDAKIWVCDLRFSKF